MSSALLPLKTRTTYLPPQAGLVVMVATPGWAARTVDLQGVAMSVARWRKGDARVVHHPISWFESRLGLQISFMDVLSFKLEVGLSRANSMKLVDAVPAKSA